MNIRFQYNKTSQQTLEKQLKIRERALPTLQNKEMALRLKVKKTRDEINSLERELEDKVQSYEKMMGMWSEFDHTLIRVKDVHLSSRKIAGVKIPIFEGVEFDIKEFSLFNKPKWFLDGIMTVERLAEIGIKKEFYEIRLNNLEYARKKTTQKVNLFEKVQIPGYQEAIIKIKRYLEDEENLSKSSQKIMRSKQEQRREKQKKEGGNNIW